MSKRSASDSSFFKNLRAKQAKTSNQSTVDHATQAKLHPNQHHNNSHHQLLKLKERFTPVPHPERSIASFLGQARHHALQQQQQGLFSSSTILEIEARLGVLKSHTSSPDMKDCRVANLIGSKKFDKNGTTSPVFQLDPKQQSNNNSNNVSMVSGVSQSHFSKLNIVCDKQVAVPPTMICQSLQVKPLNNANKDSTSPIQIQTSVETVYSGYSQKPDQRVCYKGLHLPMDGTASENTITGPVESKSKLDYIDLAIPAANYDMRLAFTTEKTSKKDDTHSNNGSNNNNNNNNNKHHPPPGWTIQRIKQRTSCSRRDQSISWRIDITKVTSIHNTQQQQQQQQQPQQQQQQNNTDVDYEVEVELDPNVMLQLFRETNQARVQQVTAKLASQLWFIMSHMNPLVADSMSAEDVLHDHPDSRAVELALAHCDALKQFNYSFQKSNHSGTTASFFSPFNDSSKSTGNSAYLPGRKPTKRKFIGCMPVNFRRTFIDTVQTSPPNGYFLSEKTDGVRHLMVFTGSTAVLIDRKLNGKAPIPFLQQKQHAAINNDPMATVVQQIKPGTVLDGEVVIHRGSPIHNQKPRAVFIVFDVLSISATEPVLQLPFEERYRHLRHATFSNTGPLVFSTQSSMANNPNMALPLVLKNFVPRLEIGSLLSQVQTKRGIRTYSTKDYSHHHKTDGIIFQPNQPYTCGTDNRLWKWKYLDTVTIDVEILIVEDEEHNKNDRLSLSVSGEGGTNVDMTRHVTLPPTERCRLHADLKKNGTNNGSMIAEIGFDGDTGEWYYSGMRRDKKEPNHISTVLGTLLELAERLTSEELKRRIGAPVGSG